MSSSFKPTRIAPAESFENQVKDGELKAEFKAPAQQLPSHYLPQSHNIKTIEVDQSYDVSAFQNQKLKEPKDPHSYAQWRRNVGVSQHNRDARFQLHELAKANLSVEQEEENRIEQEVRVRVQEHLVKLAEVTRKQAFDEGYAQGLQKARAEVVESMAQECQHLRDMLQALDSAAQFIALENEEVLLRITEQILRKIFLKEVAADQQWIVRVMTHALGMLSTRSNIKLKVNRADMARSQSIMTDLNQAVSDLKNITIEGDDSIQWGGCKVETDFGTLDASIDRIFANLHTALSEGASGAPQ